MRSFLLLFLSAFGISLMGQAGTLDTGFGTTGVVSTSFGIANSEAFSSAIQPDGKIVTGGNYTTGGNAKIAFVRYQANGTLDATFGTNGRLQINTASGASLVRSVVVLSTGNILGGGSLASKPMLVRVTSAGVADATFGTNGIVEFDGGLTGITDMKVDGGKIYGCGRLASNPTALVVFRRNMDGTADNTFGTSGFAQVASGGGQTTPSRIAFQNGKILVTGYFFDGSKFKSVTARLNSNGTQDNTFGNAGKFVSAFGNTNEYGDNMVVQSDNKILFCGRIQVGNGVQTLVYRLTENGAVDTGFGTAGKYNFAAGGTGDECTALAVQTDGKILIGGNTLNGTAKTAFIVRLTKTGQKDTSFGTAGQTNLSAGSNLSSFALQNDAKIVAAGYATTGTQISFATFRFNAGTVVGNDDIPSILTASTLFPNPVSAATALTYEVKLDASDRAQAAIYTLDGRMVYQFSEVLDLQAGENTRSLDLPALATGQYLLRVVGGQFADVKTLMVK